MTESNQSDSDNQQSGSNSSSEELETPRNGGTQKIPEYEQQRLRRIEENRARMEALGLPKMASAVMGSVVQKKDKKSGRKGKAKVIQEEEDEEYRPAEEEECLNSSTDEDDNGDEEEFAERKSSGTRGRKVKKKGTNAKKKLPVKTVLTNSDFIDDDEALMQAIALSLNDSSKPSDVANGGPSQHPSLQVADGMLNERKGNAHIKEDTGKKKRKKPIVSRVQMTEDELILHFFQFDEAGKGSINLRDVQRAAAAHDFAWMNQEIADMIYCFDSDGDGKLSLDDFRKIVVRCNMLQGSESVMGLVS